jgi:hypothetical protein
LATASANAVSISAAAAIARAAGIKVAELRGVRPRVGNEAFWWSLAHRRVHPEFAFTYTSSLAAGCRSYGVKGGSG